MKNFKLVAALSNPYLRAGVENLFTITGRMNCGILLAGSKINSFYLKILPLSNYEQERLLLTYYVSIYLSWIFVLRRCCTLPGLTKILMRAIVNVHWAAFGPRATGSPPFLRDSINTAKEPHMLPCAIEPLQCSECTRHEQEHRFNFCFSTNLRYSPSAKADPVFAKTQGTCAKYGRSQMNIRRKRDIFSILGGSRRGIRAF